MKFGQVRVSGPSSSPLSKRTHAWYPNLPVTIYLQQRSETYLPPWLVWLSVLRAALWIKGSLVRFSVRAHAWVAGQVPSRGHSRGNLTLMFLSLFLFPSPLSENKLNLLKKHPIYQLRIPHCIFSPSFNMLPMFSIRCFFSTAFHPFPYIIRQEEKSVISLSLWCQEDILVQSSHCNIKAKRKKKALLLFILIFKEKKSA